MRSPTMPVATPTATSRTPAAGIQCLLALLTRNLPDSASVAVIRPAPIAGTTAARTPDAAPTSAATAISQTPNFQPSSTPSSSDSQNDLPPTATAAPNRIPSAEPSSPSTRPWASTTRRIWRAVAPLAEMTPRSCTCRRAPTAKAVPASRTTSSNPSPVTNRATAAAFSSEALTEGPSPGSSYRSGCR